MLALEFSRASAQSVKVGIRRSEPRADLLLLFVAGGDSGLSFRYLLGQPSYRCLTERDAVFGRLDILLGGIYPDELSRDPVERTRNVAVQPLVLLRRRYKHLSTPLCGSFRLGKLASERLALVVVTLALCAERLERLLLSYKALLIRVYLRTEQRILSILGTEHGIENREVLLQLSETIAQLRALLGYLLFSVARCAQLDLERRSLLGKALYLLRSGEHSAVSLVRASGKRSARVNDLTVEGNYLHTVTACARIVGRAVEVAEDDRSAEHVGYYIAAALVAFDKLSGDPDITFI